MDNPPNRQPDQITPNQQKWLYCDNNVGLDENICRFVKKQKELLKLELECQEEELKTNTEINKIPNNKDDAEEAKASFVLSKLQVEDLSIGLYGRVVVTLVSSVEGASTKAGQHCFLPAHKFTVGDDVEIRGPAKKDDANDSEKKEKRARSIRGVVCKVTDTFISIAISDKVVKGQQLNDDDDTLPFDSSSSSISVLATSSVEVHRKIISSLDELQKHGSNQAASHRIVEAMFSAHAVDQDRKLDVHGKPFNPNLDKSQVEAVNFALSTESIALIHGPPGTGKTTTVVELIKQAVHYKQWKVLLCAPSNVAVDNVLERLVAFPTSKNSSRKIQCMRLGHPARLAPSVLEHSMERLLNSADGADIVHDCKQELQDYINTLNDSYEAAKLRQKSSGQAKEKTSKGASSKSKGASLSYSQRQQIKMEIKNLRKEIRSREEKVLRELIQSRQVILATNVGAANKVLNDMIFDLVVIDEAAQALESSCWIPALKGMRLVLAGDHKQLAPTIQSKAAERRGLGFTMFDRAMAIHAHESISRMLSVQYRMHETISDWASKAMYNGKLQSAPEVAQRTLADLPNVKAVASKKAHENDLSEEIVDINLLLIDTAGCDMEEEATAAGSKRNPGEAQIVQQHVKQLLAVGLREPDIAIITPYNGQVELLRNLLLPSNPKLEIRSVDGFQGGEREAVILSLVRSNQKGVVGFLGDDRRLNVAVTRARRHCAIICDTETVSKHEFLKQLVRWIEENGQYSSAMEYEELGEAVTTADDALIQELTTALEKNDLSDASEQETKVKHTPSRIPETTKPECKKEAAKLSNTNSPEQTEKGITKATSPSQSSRDDEEEDVNMVSSDEGGDEYPEIDSEIVPEKSEENNMNEFLKGLAEERTKRQKDSQHKLASTTQQDAKKKTKSTTKKKGKPLGRAKRQTNPSKLMKQKNEDDGLDDMAFLDREVAKVQSSHGKKIDATGSEYRRIVNGVLLNKPKTRTQEKKRDNVAASTLKQKLKEAEQSRQSKAAKEKKR